MALSTPISLESLDVFLVLPRDAPGVTLPAEDEVDAKLDPLGNAAKWTRAAGFCVALQSYHLGLLSDGGPSRAEPVVLTKKVDRASTALLNVFSRQLVLPRALLAVRVTPQGSATTSWAPHLIYTLTNARVSALTWATSNVDNVSEEHLTLTYESLTIDYHPRDAAARLLAPIRAIYPPVA